MLEMTRDVAGRISGLSCRTLLEYVGVNCLRIVAGRACVRQLSTIHGLSSDTSLNFLFGSTIDVQRDRHTQGTDSHTRDETACNTDERHIEYEKEGTDRRRWMMGGTPQSVQ